MSRHSQRFFDVGGLPTAARCLTAEAAGETALRLITEVLNTARRDPRRDERDGSVYAGDTGIALAAWHVWKQSAPGYEGLRLDEAQRGALLLAAAELCETSRTNFSSRRRVSFAEGQAGCHAVHAVILHSLRRLDDRDRAMQSLLELRSNVAELDPGENELLYGRAGYLYALLFVRRHVGEHGPLLAAAVDDVVSQLLRYGREARRGGPFSLAYAWHDKCYLGAAHGLCGILQAVLLARRWFPDAVDADDLGVVLMCVDELVAQTFESGNLPSSFTNNKDRLVQWCHGAPGLVPLLGEVVRVCRELGDGGRLTRMIAAAGAAARVCGMQGLLRKGVGLCHGISGNALALLSAARIDTIEDRGLHRAKAGQFLTFAVEHLHELRAVPDDPDSLFGGVCGLVVALLDLAAASDDDGAPKWLGFPGYEL
eukprot:m.162856 g.162856  ORF g.162856 m.162856 type:complete len:426 (+) comp17675_c0_seq5:67-1344(+)